MPLALSSERPLSRLLGAAELVARRPGALDGAAAACLAAHGVGLLSLRFEPAWAASRKLLAALASSNPDELWPPLLAHLERACAAATSPRAASRNKDREGDDAAVALDARLARLAATDDANGVEGDVDAPLDAERAHAGAWAAAEACGVVSGAGAGAARAARRAVSLLATLLVKDVFPESGDDPDGVAPGGNQTSRCLQDAIEALASTDYPLSAGAAAATRLLGLSASRPAASPRPVRPGRPMRGYRTQARTSAPRSPARRSCATRRRRSARARRGAAWRRCWASSATRRRLGRCRTRPRSAKRTRSRAEILPVGPGFVMSFKVMTPA